MPKERTICEYGRDRLSHNSSLTTACRFALTLVELLVTLTIITILFALLLPAVLAVREAGRLVQCQNNVKQIATALLTFHDMHTTFPAGGWGHSWVGIPDSGAGKQQPGGWIYHILPYVEEGSLHALGSGANDATAHELYSQRIQTPLALFVCPSRRPCSTWPVAQQYLWVRNPKPFGNVVSVARGDYAINAGSSHVFSFIGPVNLAQGDDKDFWRNAPNPLGFSGISHLRFGAAMSSIVDGTSKTYLLGEKYLEVENYATGISLGDNESLYAGYCTDLHRFAGVIENIKVSRQPYAAPLNDHAVPDSNASGFVRFGSAHSAGFNMARCDTSVQFVAYEVDPIIHFRAGHHSDRGRPIESLD